jgi:hypothetical protein
VFASFSHDEAYIPNPNSHMMRGGNQADPDGSSSFNIREDPPDLEIMDDSMVGGNRLKELALKRIEAKSPKRSLASKLAAKRAMLVADDEDDATLEDSTVATSLVSESTTDLSYSEKNSRRALILQMAKARMKSLQKENIAEDPDEGKADGRNESPPAASAALDIEDLEAPRDETSPGAGTSGELDTGMASLELD